MKRKAIESQDGRQQITAIVGEKLSAVTFVMDYIQLHFDGPMINAYTLPVVKVGEISYLVGDKGYRDALCERIGAEVTEALVDPEQKIQVDLSDGASLSISLRPEDRSVAEAAVFQDSLSDEWASW